VEGAEYRPMPQGSQDGGVTPVMEIVSIKNGMARHEDELIQYSLRFVEPL
jgi:hypothetical protein